MRAFLYQYLQISFPDQTEKKNKRNHNNKSEAPTKYIERNMHKRVTLKTGWRKADRENKSDLASRRVLQHHAQEEESMGETRS